MDSVKSEAISPHFDRRRPADACSSYMRAVGYGSADPHLGYLEPISHYNGSNWSGVPIETPKRNSYLSGVWGSSASDVWVSGFNGDIMLHESPPG